MSQVAAPVTTSTPGASLTPDTTDIFTAGHLTLVAVLAAIVIIGLIWGIRLARQRHEAAREIEAHNEQIVAEGKASDRRAGGDRRQPVAAEEPGTASVRTELLFEPLPDVSARYVTPMPKPTTAAAPPSPADAVTEVLPAGSVDRADLASADPVAEVLPAATAIEPPPAIAPEPAPAEAGPPPAEGPVTQLKGLGAKLAAKLAEHGITTVGELAALTDDEAAALDARLGPFTGRMARDRWQEQARFLAAGDRAGFEAVFGRL